MNTVIQRRGSRDSRIDHSEVERLISDFIRGAAPRSQYLYGATLDDFTRFRSASSRAEALSELLAGGGRAADAIVHQYLSRARRDGDSGAYAATTTNGRLTVLRKFTKFVRDRGLIEWQISIPCIRVSARHIQNITPIPEVDAALSLFSDDTSPLQQRNVAILRLTAEPALTPAEIVRLNIGDYWPGKLLIAIAEANAGGFDFVRLTSTTAIAIDRWLRCHPNRVRLDSPLFIGLNGVNGRMSAGSIRQSIVDAVGFLAVRRERLQPSRLRRVALNRALKQMGVQVPGQ